MHRDEKWFIKNKKGDTRGISEDLGISDVLSRILVNRQINTKQSAREFLHPNLKGMHDPFLLKDMDKALDIIIGAIEDGTKILLVGDYDVDGVMGLALLHEALSKYCSDIAHYIPHRLDDGYGLNSKAIEKARDESIGLIITCDNGVSSFEPVEEAKKLGISVIVTDHHDVLYTTDAPGNAPLPRLVQADAVIDPKQPECGYPFKQLCGTGVAYKLVTALFRRLGEPVVQAEYKKLFTYVAVATLCDVVELTDENRAFVHYGMKFINEGIGSEGLRALIEACGLVVGEIDSYSIGHILGPCINAAGRIESAEKSFALFNTNDYREALDLAVSLCELNKERQQITMDAFEISIGLLTEGGEQPDDNVIVLYLPDIHESVAGIVAGRIRDRFARPAIVLTNTKDGKVKGSGRSLDGFDMFSCLNELNDRRGILLNFGGHSMAVGLSLKNDDVDVLKEEIKNSFDAGALSLAPKVMIDLEYPIDDLNKTLIDELKLLEPYGKGNSKPLFAAKGINIEYAALVGQKRNVIKLKLSSNNSEKKDIIINNNSSGGSGSGSGSNSSSSGSNSSSSGSNSSSSGSNSSSSNNNSNSGNNSKMKKSIDAVYFGDIEAFLEAIGLSADRGELLISDGPPVYADIVYCPDVNTYRGLEKVQLIIQNIRRAI